MTNSARVSLVSWEIMNINSNTWIGVIGGVIGGSAVLI